MKWTLLFDADKCNGCRNCVLATLDEHTGNSFAGSAGGASVTEPPLVIVEHERGTNARVDVTFFPKMCQHCADMPCATSAPEGGVTLRADGLVRIDPENCRGKSEMVKACPYGVLVWNEERDVPEHWTFDTHLLDAGWMHPRAVQACPTRALEARRLSDAEFSALAEQSGPNPLTPEGTSPGRVLYFNTNRIGKAFISGCIVSKENGMFETVEGAEISLNLGTDLSIKATTDAFGDFLIDGMAPAPAQGLLTVTSNGLSVTREISFDGSPKALGRIEIN